MNLAEKAKSNPNQVSHRWCCHQGFPMRSVSPVIVVALSCLLTSPGPAAIASTKATKGHAGIDLGTIFSSITPTGPGCVAGVKIAGMTPSVAAYGQADLEHAVPLTPASVFETGSLAKQFTASAILLLAQDHKLSLDDDIRRFLPEMPDYGTPITIRHLLTHTSGLREQWSLLALAGSSPGSHVHSQATILDLASRQKGLNFRPGAEFLYTNTNYVLAAIIIERVSGESLQQFTDRRLFQPLGMTRTRWREDFRTTVQARAMAYAQTDAGFTANMPFTNVYGNGGLLTTVGDLLRWNAFLDAPKQLPGGPALVTALETSGRLSNGTPLAYGMGLEITSDHGRRLVSHSGSTGGYKTWLGRYPAEGVSIAILCNNGGIDPTEMGERLAGLVLRSPGQSPGVAPVSQPVSLKAAAAPMPDLAPYTGLFRNAVSGELLRLEAVGNKLMLSQGAVQALALLSEDRFQRTDGGIIQFTRRGTTSTELTLSQGQTSQTFVAVQAAKTNIGALAAYDGTYYSAELDTRITVSRSGGTLIMRQPFAMEWALKPSFADGFTTNLRGTTSFVFQRAVDGNVTGFSAWGVGMRNVVFVRLSPVPGLVSHPRR